MVFKINDVRKIHKAKAKWNFIDFLVLPRNFAVVLPNEYSKVRRDCG